MGKDDVGFKLFKQLRDNEIRDAQNAQKTSHLYGSDNGHRRFTLHAVRAAKYHRIARLEKLKNS